MMLSWRWDMESIDSCINRLKAIEEELPFWRELTEAEVDNNIHEMFDDLRFSEEEGTSVVKHYTDEFLQEQLLLFKEYISKGYDLMHITNSLKLKQEAQEDIAKFIASTYVKGHISVKGSSVIDADWVSEWSLKKAALMVKKIETDMHYRILMELLDEEKPGA
jgi:hypothetical protein